VDRFSEACSHFLPSGVFILLVKFIPSFALFKTAFPKPDILILRPKMFLLTKKEVLVIFIFFLSNTVSEHEPSVLRRH